MAIENVAAVHEYERFRCSVEYMYNRICQKGMKEYVGTLYVAWFWFVLSENMG